MAVPQNPRPGGCGEHVRLVNGSFEDVERTTVGEGEMKFILDATRAGNGDGKPWVPGWKTTARDHMIEIWGDRYKDAQYGAVPAKDGKRFAELNANYRSTLYQDVSTRPGTTLYWRLWHRGRRGKDTMQVKIGPAPSGQEPFRPNNDDRDRNLTDDRDAWGEHSNTYTVPDGQETTRFAFVSVSSTGGDTIGNFLDGISFGTAPCVVLTKKAIPTGGDAKAGDVITYEVTAVNEGGSPAAELVLADPVPPGTTYVPGSLRIVSGPGAGQDPLTDRPGDDRAYHDQAGRRVVFHLGDGATPARGGSLKHSGDLPGGTTVQFQVRVDHTAQPIENQATATYRNAQAPPAEQSKTSTSNAVLTPVAQSVRLELHKAADRLQTAVGEVITFHLVLTNAGPSQATGVKVTDRLPRQLRYLSAAPTTGAYDPATGIWSIDTLAARATARLELRAIVTAPGPIRNRATATANESKPGTGTGAELLVCAHRRPPCTPGHGTGGGGCGGDWDPTQTCPDPDTCGHTASGHTSPGAGWQQSDGKSLHIDVDTSSGEFTTTPHYVASIGSSGGSQWLLRGAHGIYDATPTGFRLNLYWTEQDPLTPQTAEQYGWYVNWIGHQAPSRP
ncbi:DUF11 domain-containing protein [Actinomadura fibrosa]|uniref:DUF11 domain-containing protein n=1 Tax=Actinomadura fibrosa TaxID=111802 RepID=A0ABW2XIS1_9ACTN|nr:DUF11 domain-containing protein [Actinomadura fibrosa]